MGETAKRLKTDDPDHPDDNTRKSTLTNKQESFKTAQKMKHNFDASHSML